MQIEEQTSATSAIPWAQLRIPSFPQISMRVLQLAGNETVPIRELSDLICSDPAFSSEVLTIANSPLYGRRLPVNTVMQAIALLGTQSLKGLCLTIGVRAYLGKSLNRQALRAIWRHSLGTALIAEQIAVPGLIDKGATYTAGIMHDIGRLVLALLRPDAYSELLESHVGSPCSILKSEQQLFGFDHCAAGHHLVQDWNLPAAFEAIVCRHHAPPAQSLSWRMVDLIALSCRMADTAGFAVFPGCEITPFPELLQQLPPRERKAFAPDIAELAFEIGSKINALESV